MDLKYLPILAVLCSLFGAKGENVLIIHPLYSGSHVLTLLSVAEQLAENGHNVDIIRWKDLHTFPKVISPRINITTLAMENSEGRWSFLTQEKSAAFKVVSLKNDFL